MKKRKHIFESFQHFIVGFYLVVEGYAKMTHDAAVIGGIIMALGVILLLYFVYNRIKAKQSFTLKVLTHLFEAMALAFTAYILFKEGTHYLKYINLLASIAMFISVIIMLKKKKQKGLAE